MTLRYILVFGSLVYLAGCGGSTAVKPALTGDSAAAENDAGGAPEPAPAAPVGNSAASQENSRTAPTPSAGAVAIAKKPGRNPALPSADALADQAEAALKTNNFDEALKRAGEALAQNAQHPKALRTQALAFQGQAQLLKQPQQSEQRNTLFLSSAAAMRKLRDLNPSMSAEEKGLLAIVLYNEACVHASTGASDKALDSLNDAIDAGFADQKLFETDADLVSLRAHPRFKEITKKIATAIEHQIRAGAKKLLADQKPFDFEFKRPSVRSNKVVKIADYKGKVLVVDLWATWCPPCREEVPHLVDLYKKYKDKGLEVVGMNFEGTAASEAKATIREFAKKNKINYTLVLGDERTKNQVPDFQGYPTLLYFDRSGQLRLMQVGYRPYAFLEAVTTTLMEEPGVAISQK